MAKIHTFLVPKQKRQVQTLRFQGSERARYPRFWLTGRLAFLALFLIFCLAVPSEAGLVYGRLMRDSKALGNMTFTLTDERGNSIQVKTDPQGNYRIMIPPGVYRVTYTEGNVVWGAEIRSYPNEIQQDIQLRQRR
jgi:hypothetical protein